MKKKKKEARKNISGLQALMVLIPIWAIMGFLILGVDNLAMAKEFEAQKFKTTFIIQFNAITLEEAARLEVVIKNKFKDACKIKVELDKAGSTITGGALICDDGSNSAVWITDAVECICTGDDANCDC